MLTVLPSVSINTCLCFAIEGKELALSSNHHVLSHLLYTSTGSKLLFTCWRIEMSLTCDLDLDE